MSRRHRIAGRKLNRNRGQRQALFKSLIRSLILEEEIQTTAPKAKAVQRLVDKLVAKGKLGTLHTRRLLSAFLGDKTAVNKLVDEVSPRMKERPSGFTRIIKLGRRRGDDAQIVSLSFVDQAEAKPEKVSKPKVTKTDKAKVSKKS
jgi:large subunit ribosomal protein L17